jgi:hypothetical protein
VVNQADVHYVLKGNRAILAAPLILSADIRNLTAEEYQVITNAEVIAVNQDEDGIQGERVSKDGDLEVWARYTYKIRMCIAYQPTDPFMHHTL